MDELEKHEKEKSFLYKLKKFILGTEKPSFFTRIFFFVSMTITSLFFVWAILGFVATFFIDYIDHADKARAVFNKIGIEYGINDMLSQYKTFVIISIVCYILSAVGLVLIWREKMTGYFAFFIGYTSVLFAIPIFLSFRYLSEEISIFQHAFYALATLPILVLFFINFSKKRRQKAELSQSGT